MKGITGSNRMFRHENILNFSFIRVKGFNIPPDRRPRIFGSMFAAGLLIGKIIFLLGIFPVLLGACDLMGGSVLDYIDYNTSVVRVAGFDVTSVINSNYINKTKDVWVHHYSPDYSYPNLNGKMQFKVVLDNPHNYDLVITPVIDEFIGEDGKRVSKPPERIGISASSEEANTVNIIISGAEQGDSFKFHLDIATKDGTRVFEPFTSIPQIIYDTVLQSAREVQRVPASNPGGQTKATWKIQGPSEHVGINKLSVIFRTVGYGPNTRNWNFSYKEDPAEPGVWKWLNDDPSVAEYYRELSAETNEDTITTFTLPFPFAGDSDANTDGFGAGYSFVVTITDKNGQRAIAGTEGAKETELKSLEIWYRTRGQIDFFKADWEFVPDTLNYASLVVPYNIDRVKFRAERADDNFGVQSVIWDGTNSHSDEIAFPLEVRQGPNFNKFAMEVQYENPSDIDNPPPRPYNFSINRLSANRDSTLKNLIVQDLAGKNFDIVGGFAAPSWNPDEQGIVTTAYTVYVPSSVTSIRIMGDFLNTSEIYNEKGRPALGGNGAPDLPSPYPQYQANYDGQITEFYQDDDYVEVSDLKIIRNGWTYNVQPGNNYFYFNVKPQNDNNETQTRRYIITVKKTDPSANQNARLQTLSIKTRDGNETGLLGNDLLANPFDPAIFNYKVYVPNAVTLVELSGQVGPGAYISEITSVDLNSGLGDQLSYTPASTEIHEDDPLVISLNGLVRKRVTLTLYYGAAGSTPNNYVITLIKSQPALAAPQLEGGDRGLKVSFNAVQGAAYEVCYSLFDEADPARNIPELAVWKGPDSFSSGSWLLGLLNNHKYNVWVRQKHAKNPGEWTLAKTSRSGVTPSIIDFGIPGTPVLAGFSFDPLDPDISGSGISFSPALNTAVDRRYTVTVPSGVTGLTITAETELGVTAQGPLTVSPLPAGETNPGGVIEVRSPDGKTVWEYYISVFRALPPPPNFRLVSALEGVVALEWDAYSADISGAGWEFYYNTANDFASASRWIDHNAGSCNATVTSLKNQVSYHFWVRGIKGGTPGEPSYYGPVQPKGNSNTLGSLHSSLGVLIPAFHPETDSYNLYLDSENGQVTFTGGPGQAHQVIAYPGDTGNSANPAKGNTQDVTVTVKSDAKINGYPGAADEKTYTITVHKRLGPPALESLATRSGSITINWQAPEDGTAASYEVYYLTQNLNLDDVDSAANKVSIPGTQRNVTISGLVNGSTYYVWVRAVNGSGVNGNFLALSPVTLPHEGTPAIHFDFDEPEDIDVTWTLPGGSSSISWSDNPDTEIMISIQAGYYSYEWYVDGVKIADLGHELIKRVRDFSVALHSVTARIRKTQNGPVYSRTAVFQVDD